jgi:hypothetical protein
MQIEAEDVSQVLDRAIVRHLRRDGRSEKMVAGFQAATQSRGSSPARRQWMAEHREGELADEPGLVAAAESSALISSFACACADLAFTDRQSEIDALRSKISGIAPRVLGGEELAFVAERVRNLRNISLLAELARLSGLERRQDLFARIHAAAIKSDAPGQFVSLLTGFAMPIDAAPVPPASISTAAPSIALHNPLSSQTPVRFTIEGQGAWTLQPGETMAVNATAILGFDNGVGTIKRYTLRDGFFQWRIEDGSWDIRKKAVVKFVIDASQSALPFHYLVDGEPKVIKPGAIAEHSSTRPPRIDFDRGISDGEIATKILNPGRFRVFVDPRTSAFELYASEAQSPRETSTTRGRAVRAWRESVARVRSKASDDPLGTVDQTLDSLLNEIE